jgi:hypothetical protein
VVHLRQALTGVVTSASATQVKPTVRRVGVGLAGGVAGDAEQRADAVADADQLGSPNLE